MASFTRRMRILGHSLMGDRAGQPRAGKLLRQDRRGNFF